MLYGLFLLCLEIFLFRLIKFRVDFFVLEPYLLGILFCYDCFYLSLFFTGFLFKPIFLGSLY